MAQTGRFLVLISLMAASLFLLAGGVGGCCPSGSEVVTTDAHWELQSTTLSNVAISVTTPDGTDVPVTPFSSTSAPIAATFDPAVGALGFVLAADATAVDVVFCEPSFGPITENDTPQTLLSSPSCKIAYLGLAPEPSSCQGTGTDQRDCTFTLVAQPFQVDTQICHFDEASGAQTCVGDTNPVYQVSYQMQADTLEVFIHKHTQCL